MILNKLDEIFTEMNHIKTYIKFKREKLDSSSDNLAVYSGTKKTKYKNIYEFNAWKLKK